MSRISARCRALPPAAIALVAVLFCLSTGTARAGTYDVTSCNPDGTAAGWLPYNPGSVAQPSIACPARGDLTRGLTVVNTPNAGVFGYSGGGLMFNAPPGTSLVGVGASMRMQRSDRSYWMGLIGASGANLFGWWANDGPTGYSDRVAT